MDNLSGIIPSASPFGAMAPGNSQGVGGNIVPASAPYGSRQSGSTVLWQADGSPYKTSARFPQKGDDKNYVDIHNLSPYEQVLHTYESSHGYRDNSYLIFFPREEWYQERQKYSMRSVVAFRSVVDAMVQPVFEKEILRVTDNPMYENFIENADNTGTSLQDINETAQTHARILGLTFIVMDNFKDADKANTLQSALDNRMFPYIYEKMPQDVYKWKCNNWGQLEWITFYERIETIPDPEHEGKFIQRQYYRRWEKTQWVIYYEKKNEKKFDEFTEIVESSALHGLNYLPIYPVMDYTKNNNLTNFPTPLLADIANMAFVLYNVESWIMLLGVYCFPILVLPPMDGIQIALSVNNAIVTPQDAKFAPGFISPPTACLQTLINMADRIEEKIYKAANQLGVSGSRAGGGVQAISGISKEWDFRASNSLLKKTGHAAKKLEEWCAKTFSDYTHQSITFEVNFPSEFVEAYSQQRITRAIALLQEMPPDTFKKELWKEIVKIFFDDDTDKAKTVCDMIDTDYAAGIQEADDLKYVTAGEGEETGEEKGEGEEGKENPVAKEKNELAGIVNDIISKFSAGKK